MTVRLSLAPRSSLSLGLQRRSALTMQHALGRPGNPGEPGTTWFAESGAPSASEGREGDFYLNTDSWALYRKDETGAWAYLVDLDYNAVLAQAAEVAAAASAAAALTSENNAEAAEVNAELAETNAETAAAAAAASAVAADASADAAAASELAADASADAAAISAAAAATFVPANYVAKAGDTMTGTLGIQNTEPTQSFNDTDGPVNQKRWTQYVRGGAMNFERYTDAGAYVSTPFAINADGTATLQTAPAISDNSGLVASTYWVRQLIEASPSRFQVQNTYPHFAFWDTDGGLNRKRAHFAYDGGSLGWHRYTDAGAYSDTPFFIDTSGNVCVTYDLVVTGIAYADNFTADLGTGGSCIIKGSGESVRTGWMEWRRESGARVAYMGYVLDGDNGMDLCFESDTGAFRVINGGINPEWGYTGRAGCNGTSSNYFNIYWNGSHPYLYIDTSDQGILLTASRVSFRHVAYGDSGSISAGNWVDAVGISGVGSAYCRGYLLTSYHYARIAYTQIYIGGTWYTNGIV